jgi:hypothetical protein
VAAKQKEKNMRIFFVSLMLITAFSHESNSNNAQFPKGALEVGGNLSYLQVFNLGLSETHLNLSPVANLYFSNGVFMGPKLNLEYNDLQSDNYSTIGIGLGLTAGKIVTTDLFSPYFATGLLYTYSKEIYNQGNNDTVSHFQNVLTIPSSVGIKIPVSHIFFINFDITYSLRLTDEYDIFYNYSSNKLMVSIGLTGLIK